MNILFFGDVVGKPGRIAVGKILPLLREEYQPDLVIANAENLAHGKGITLSTINFMLDLGVDFFTTGNHVFDKPEATAVFEKYPDKIIRPANIISGNEPVTDISSAKPFLGAGFKIIPVKGTQVLIINLLGQAFMEKQFDQGLIENPFLKLNEILNQAGGQAQVRFLDFHAEATSEKRAMGFWVDGRLSAVLGTHTHVPTADGQILPQGTGYQTDAGMTGAAMSVIGVDTEGVLKRFTSDGTENKKTPMDIATGLIGEVSFVMLEIDEKTGKCQNIISQVRYI